MDKPCIVLKFEGDLLLGELRQFERAVDAALAEGRSAIILDLSGVRYCSCSTLGVLARAAARLRDARRQLLLAGASPALRRFIAAAGFAGVLETADRVEDARVILGPQVLTVEREALLSEDSLESGAEHA